MSLSPDQVRQIARLARLSLSDAQVAAYQTQLSSILAHMDTLRKLDLAGVEPLTHIAESVNRLDDDVPGPTLPNEVLMKMAAAAMPPFVKVPKVLDEGGGA